VRGRLDDPDDDLDNDPDDRSERVRG
jgi:hypothetical protein